MAGARNRARVRQEALSGAVGVHIFTKCKGLAGPRIIAKPGTCVLGDACSGATRWRGGSPHAHARSGSGRWKQCADAESVKPVQITHIVKSTLNSRRIQYKP